MDILDFTYPLGILLIFIFGIGLGIYLTRRFKLGWRLWWIGAATFILSQIGHIPFNAGVTALFANGTLPAPPESWSLAFNTVFLGLSAGLWEEWTRYAVLRWWAKDARSWSQGLLWGAGHGGIEAIGLVGGLAILTYVNMIVLRSLDLSAVVPPDQLELTRQAVETYWGAPWYLSLLPAVERLAALVAHISFALLVMQTFLSGKIRWTWAAVLWHAIFDMVAVYFSRTTNVYITELILVLMIPLSLAIIYGLRRIQPILPPQEVPPPPLPPPEPVSITGIEETPENLDRTRYGVS